jgi:hypothetical protein
MKQLCARLLVIAALGMLLASTGCIMNQTDLVITDEICVNIDEHETTGTFSTFVVCDQIKQELEKDLAKYGKGPKDVKAIHMIGGTFKTMAVNPMDTKVTGDINIARQDTPGGAYDDGPAPFTSFHNQSLKALQGKPTDATLAADGVALVDRALASLLVGQDPRLVLIVDNETVTPTPTPSSPLDFKLRTCVRFQVVITGDHHHGNGHH